MHELVLLLTDYAGNIPSMYRILLTMREFSAYGFTDRSVFCSIARNIPMNLFKQEGMKLTLKNTEHLIYQITRAPYVRWK
ncbi:hypothetical protein DORFOR_00594 [Dorea formicigenerans ATCC 27755]|jgi:hypothetical protein|uniref:Uncharacterized protein n=2 Tax=Dorea formicigenerans TaxID=39486 RepID=B0G2X4_9FIRM|nr:hypothetical protein DORFOR_00594 [Dorea formicigenerans ATCC 27755]RGW53978.1 hypothetical protein DWV67_06960 [Dorea formicigenerans]